MTLPAFLQGIQSESQLILIVYETTSHILKFLFDENCSPSNKFLETHPICENVKYRLEEAILLYMEEKMSLVIFDCDQTGYSHFNIRSLLQNHPKII